MERREELETRAGSGRDGRPDARTALTEMQGTSERELDEVGKELAALETGRESLTPVFDPDLLELYDDLRRQKKGDRRRRARRRRLPGVSQQLSAVELDRLRRADGVRRCEHCRRILVF